MKNHTLAEIVFHTGLKLINVTRLSLWQTKAPIILCYHGIGKDEWRFTLSPKLFQEHIDWLTKNKKVVKITDLLSEREENSLAITFDDGYKDVFKNALPILNESGLSASVFVLGSPRSANRNELGNNKPLMNKKMINALRKHGWEIGFHTNTHADIAVLDSDELDKEIIIGKKDLEKKLGTKLKYFAYPRGAYSKRILNMVSEAGFSNAFTIDGGPALLNGDKLRVARNSIDGPMSVSELKALVSYPGLWFMKFFIKALQLKENISRKVNRDEKSY